LSNHSPTMVRRCNSGLPTSAGRVTDSDTRRCASSCSISPKNVETPNIMTIKRGANRAASSMPSILNVIESTCEIYPSNEKETKKTANSTRTKADLLCNFMRAEIASTADEITFVTMVETHGLREAMRLAAIFDLKCLRPLQALLSVSSVPGKSYTKQSAKHKPLLSAKVSLKKRS